MEILRKYIWAIFLLFAVVVVWLGITFFIDARQKSIVGDINQYTSVIESSFNMDVVNLVYERSEKTLPETPKEFLLSVQ
ncbi:TPA: hypothetical protein GX533_03005 [Candidatus Dojkabacteria bacterium]|jgi:hypothetical protein|uniref:Uncharacterized protein n=1 Tax=Candidatus Dojkabacteria bacterium TaxID=2099670 RepID=A0A832Q8B6_9BACT|nr:hypothetical protein [Candidatus Dojkabacteria bacterium]